jgi:DEAD/DEAH box helicase domain-containing protein
MALTDSPLDTLLGALDDVGDPGIVHIERLAPRPAQVAEPHRPLHPEVRAALGVDALWSHQVAALDLAREGRSVAVATGTASGKSLCYQVPIAEAALDPVRPGTALCIFPTKALAQDQLRAFTDLGLRKLAACTYDGDCTPEARAHARKQANVLLTNPEMLHCGILPHHHRWATFLMRLRYVVVDELHTMRGIFGSHVAHVLRRLRRLCARYGASPTFIFTSATIGEPARLASALCGLPVEEVSADGSPRGERVVVLWNPPLLDLATGARASSRKTTARMVASLVTRDHRCIAFSRSRRATETVAAEARRLLPRHLSPLVRPYRGGYLAAERREIEGELADGRLKGVIATTALELGVDIGGLDACVLDGFPGTISSFWQQAGRAGRARQRSLAVLVAGEDALDQYLAVHPDELFTRPPEPAVVNLSNPYVLDAHLTCAAFEAPLTLDDEQWWDHADLADGVRRLVTRDRLELRRVRRGHRHPQPKAVWADRGFPSHGVGLRSGSSRELRIALSDGTLVGTVDTARAPAVVHPGAMYLHQGRCYRVLALDLDEAVAVVEPATGDESTQARSSTRISVLDDELHRPVGRADLHLGTVEVVSQITGYQRRDLTTGEMLGVVPLELPPARLVTRSFWYVIDPAVLEAAGVEPAAVPGTLHAAEHAAIGILPLFAICDRWDVGGVSTPWQADTGGPTIFVHDGYPGGAGIAELGYGAADRHLAATLDVLLRCRCERGCPSCVQSPKCGNLNEPLDKAGAISLLRRILD